MNQSILEYINAEQTRRNFNKFYCAGYVLIFVCSLEHSLKTTDPIKFFFVFAIFAGVISLFHGMTNVCLLLATPKISASDDEILEAAKTAPRWFANTVVKLQTQES